MRNMTLACRFSVAISATTASAMDRLGARSVPWCDSCSESEKQAFAILLLPSGAASCRKPLPVHDVRTHTMLQKVKPALQLKDMSLFRQQCYVDGQWVD